MYYVFGKTAGLSRMEQPRQNIMYQLSVLIHIIGYRTK